MSNDERGRRGREISSSRLRRVVVITSLVTVDVAFTMSPAAAACHAFTVSASPTTVNEGGRITVTVTRDANVNPSAVDVRTVDGSARSGADFAGGRRTISFTVENQRSYTIPTVNDTVREGAETFRIELVPNSGSGCAVQPNFSYGPPVTVTIRASDQPPATPPPAPAPPTRRATAAATAPVESASPRPRLTTGPTTTATGQPLATTAPPVASLSASPTATAASVATTDSEDDDAPIGLIIGALALAAGVGTAAVYFLRQRRLSG